VNKLFVYENYKFSATFCLSFSSTYPSGDGLRFSKTYFVFYFFSSSFFSSGLRLNFFLSNFSPAFRGTPIPLKVYKLSHGIELIK